MQNALHESLNDVDPYVKKTAIIGCVKFFHLSKSQFKKTEFLNQLYNLTKDTDPLVVINAIEAVNEIQADKGGLDIDRGLIIPLLNRIKDFNEWGQSIILDITSKYEPKDQQEKFDIMNLLEDRFKHASSSVVLGTVKVFLHLTKDDENLYK
jgi:AP-4 complex subunit beta-1